MIISYKWLQSYFDEKLPPPEKLAELITFGFAEVEGVEKKGDDTVLDVKVLPDRACYALSHRGVAYEVAAITGFKQKIFDWPEPSVTKVRPLVVKVEAPELCSRYVARVIENVTAKAQPWVKEHLEAIGQRSINPIVDGANIVMFDMGQPLHAFDADKVEGGIIVRRAKKGEKIITLDNREVFLDESVLIIADEVSPLAIAGIKGGKKAEVTESTKNLILESANFNASHTRQTAERLGIKTDASKRFENRLSPALAERGMKDFTAYLFETDKNLRAGEIIDWYPKKADIRSLEVGKEDINAKLGVVISEKEIEDMFFKLKFEFEKRGDGWLITPPAFRMDVFIPEDVVEEVARIYGYNKIIPTEINRKKVEPVINIRFNLEFKIREFLVSRGFSEIMTSSFAKKGEAEVMKPTDSTRPFFRAGLSSALKNALDKNALNADLLGLDKIKIFEIGKVFSGGEESTSLCVGIAHARKRKGERANDEIKTVRDELFRELGGNVSVACTDDGGVLLINNKPVGEINKIDGVLNLNLDQLVSEGQTYRTAGLTFRKGGSSSSSRISLRYKPFSLFPFIVRDIAFFVGEGVGEEEAQKTLGEILQKHSGELLVSGPRLFDQFEKSGRKSFAYRMVFQSFDRTLTDGEVNEIMEKVTSDIFKLGWVVR